MTKTGNWNRALVRSASAGILLAFVLAGLWRAGLMSSGGGKTLDNEVVPDLRPADAAVETPLVAGRTVGLRVGDLSPDFEFSDYQGRRLRLSDFRGRPVFVNFWATWCGPCRVEMPTIQTILDRYQPFDLAVIAVNYGEAAAPAKKFIDNLTLRFTAFAYDPNADVGRRYEVVGMPTSVFIDADGLITRVLSGQLSLKVMESSVEEAIIGAGKVQAAP